MEWNLGSEMAVLDGMEPGIEDGGALKSTTRNADGKLGLGN